MAALRLTMAQALVRHLIAQRTMIDGTDVPLFGGVFAIFGHGNVAGLGEALHRHRERLPTFRAHNEQGMAHAAIAYAKASRRRRMLACTTSIGPGATNMVTAAALAHVNRLPVLLLPGEAFASRRPDPVLQQIEDYSDPNVTANDCFRPVCRYWDRITRPEQLVHALPQALSVLLDPAECGPALLALPQDVQTEACDYPADFFAETHHGPLRQPPDDDRLRAAAECLGRARKPLVVAGGGVHYSDACEALAAFAARFRLPVAETQAGKGALPWDHPCNVGAIGVTGSAAANRLAADADAILAIGTRLQDFTTASGTLFRNAAHRVVALNVCRHDVMKRGALPLRADALRGLEALEAALSAWAVDASWVELAQRSTREWRALVDRAIASGGGLPSDAQVIGVVNREIPASGTVVGAAGGLPGELHKLWRAAGPGSYHVEYGYSCMGYEIAGGLGVKMAQPEREVVVMLGDGSYLMMNSEIATSVAMGRKLVIVVLDNRGFGCISRLQRACGGEEFNNLLDADPAAPRVDFAAHAQALGAHAQKVAGLDELAAALAAAFASERTSVIVIDTDPEHSTGAGGAWWDVPVPEVSESAVVKKARARYEQSREKP